jgi:glycosyltransferase involved in cell wall biosynthesis
MQTKISGVVLTKDEGKNLADCIKSVKNYLDEIIVIDSSAADGDMKQASGCRYFPVQNTQSFADLRNYGNQMASNEWILHIDVDEIFSTSFFRDADVILKDTKPSASAYAFPRINLPYYELYPDYQTRLVHKKNTIWYGEVHEKVRVLTDPKDTINLDMYPIVHRAKPNKVEVNVRWDAIKKHRNVLICSLFRDSGPFIDRFLACMDKMIDFSTKQGYMIELCFIEGNSQDDTYLKLKHWLMQCNHRHIFKKMEISSEISRFERLAIMRNMLLKFGLKNYHEYMLMIDSDTIFNEDLLHRLSAGLEDNRCSAIAPIIFVEQKQPANYFYDRLAYLSRSGDHFRHEPPYTPELAQCDTAEVQSVGTCYLVRANHININDVKDHSFLRCVSEMKDGFVRYEAVWNNAPISEQTGFFYNLKKKDPNAKIIVDKRILIHHVNLEKYGLQWH